MGYFTYTDEMYKRSEYDKDMKLIRTIKQLINLSKKVRMEGVLGVEAEIDEIEGDFYKIIFSMFIYGTDSDIQFDFGRNIIQTTDISGSELRNMMIYNKGLAMIDKGESPYLVEKILYSMIGKY